MKTKNVLDTLYERGFIGQTVYEDDMRKLLDSESVPFYVGFDYRRQLAYRALHSRYGNGAHATRWAQTNRFNRRRHRNDRRPVGKNGHAKHDDERDNRA